MPKLIDTLNQEQWQKKISQYEEAENFLTAMHKIINYCITLQQVPQELCTGRSIAFNKLVKEQLNPTQDQVRFITT